MAITENAQEVLNVLERVRVHPETEKYLEPGDRGTTPWLPMDNIVNGHHEDVSEEYMGLMEELHTALNDLLIGTNGGHSYTYYELKKLGHRLETGESDSFGPLSAVVYCPNANWRVCYG